ncbi:MAG: hypothetical protein WKF47_17660 [Geodermatophilaceae bacterium]
MKGPGRHLNTVGRVDLPLPAVHVYSIPLRTRFRGIAVREGVLVHGPAGWGSSPRSSTTAHRSPRGGGRRLSRQPRTAGRCHGV